MDPVLVPISEVGGPVGPGILAYSLFFAIFELAIVLALIFDNFLAESVELVIFPAATEVFARLTPVGGQPVEFAIEPAPLDDVAISVGKDSFSVH